MTQRHELTLPDLGLPGVTPTASVWFVEAGSEVTLGDRLLEVLCGSVTVDLPSPVSGVVIETLVTEDDPLVVGQALAIIEAFDDEHDGDDAP